MRFLACALLLATAAILAVGGWQTMGGRASGVQQFLGLGMLGLACGAAAIGVLALVRQPFEDDYDGTVFSFLPDRWQDRLAMLFMVVFAVLIVFMLLRGLAKGFIPRLVDIGTVSLSVNPAGFALAFALWSALAWVLGWFLPRRMRATHGSDQSED